MILGSEFFLQCIYIVFYIRISIFNLRNWQTKYITGNYDLEILTLPRMYVNDVNIRQSHTTKVMIPEPGIATFYLPSKGVVSIFEMVNNKLERIRDVNPDYDQETIVLHTQKTPRGP